MLATRSNGYCAWGTWMAALAACAATATGQELVIVFNENGAPMARSQIRLPADLEPHVSAAAAELSTEKKAEYGALIVVPRTRDEREVTLDVRLYAGGGYRPARGVTDEALTFEQRHGQEVELRILAAGYHDFRRKGLMRSGQIIVWDDVYLEPVTERTAVTIRGRVRLEGGADPAGIHVSGNSVVVTETDERGAFELKGLGAGSISVVAGKEGYLSAVKKVEAGPGERAEVELVMYLERSALVRWAYQPNGSADLVNGVVGGRAVISPRGLHRVSFANGFEQVSGKSDFMILQEDRELYIRCFDVQGRKEGFVEFPGASFDRVTEAPRMDYKTSKRPLRAGSVYVFHCYDNEHYAKMEVVRILDSDDEVSYDELTGP